MNEQLVQLALDAGAAKAEIISVDQIVRLAISGGFFLRRKVQDKVLALESDEQGGNV